ncbi:MULTISPECIES: class I SAM-dependent methyltransferase [unclassified Yoonia]|uniref:class I SAM-dependent methyltransferase n=1 Tax=unclassified Yoonia TaxID=2629118 RepID=UPI002AFF3A4F|nr:MULTISPECIES: methyltransferase [unclassified Yoonia]
MSQSRLTTAIQDGLIVLPAGMVTLMRPPATYDVSELPSENVHIMHGYYPDVADWRAAGYDVSQDMTACTTAIVVLPRAKALAQALITEACAKADLVIVDGQRTDGVDSLFKSCRARLGDLPSVTKAHGRMFWFPASDAFADWAAGPPEKGAHGLYTAAGVFSDGAVDAGSALLAAALPPKLPKRMADLGAGWGYLAQAVLTRDSVVSLDLIEAEAQSLACARLNVTDPRAVFHWADALQFSAKPAYDGIVMNPPFHTGRAADAGLGRAFIAAAARLLTPGGKLWMVANRHLPYETTMAEHFRNVDIIGGNGAFKVFHATKPIR